MNLIALCIRQPVTVIVGVILVVLAGTLSLTRLPVQLTPSVESTIITVTTAWEGASPEEIELNVVDKQEERLLGISGLRLVTSTSQQGNGAIRLEFHTGTDKEAALREVTQKLNEVPDYPENVDEPVIEESDRENRDYIAWIVFGTTDPAFDIRVLRDFAVDRIEPVLERVPGVSEVNVLGGREREVQIRVDPVRLAQYGVTPGRFVEVVRGTNRNVSAGQLAEGKLDVRVRTVGQYESLEQIEETVLHDGGTAGQVRVGDVADAVLTFKEPLSFVRSKGRPVIAINADREIGTNVMQVMAGLREEIARLNAPGGMLDAEARRLGLNGALTVEQVYDQTVYIEDAIDLVRSNIWVGGGLAVFVLVLFLRSIRPVAIITLAIPISVIGAVVAMVAMGRSINVISLAGMAFAVGMVVDNAIVVLENIFRHLEMGKSPRAAAMDGTREVWGAVLASTLTTLVAFVPILLVEEEAGQLFRDIALAISAAVGLSLLVSVTVAPSAAARWLKGKKQGETSRSRYATTRGFAAWLGRMVHRMCGSTLARLAVVALLTSVSIAGTIWMRPPADYLPTGNRNLVFGLILPPPGYHIDQMSRMAERIEETVRPFWEAGDLGRAGDPAAADALAALPAIPTFDWARGQSGPPVVPPTLENYFLVSFEGILFHGGVSDDPKRVVDMIPLFAHATRAEVLPGVIAFPFQVPLFQLGGSSGSAVKLQLAGPDLPEVVRVAGAIYRELGAAYGYGSIQPVPSNFTLSGPEIRVEPDLVRLSELGLSTQDVGLLVQMCGDGAIIDEYRLGGESIDLKVIAAEAVEEVDMERLDDQPIAAPSGQVVPLGSVARVRRVNSPPEIARVGRQRSVSFQVTAPPGKPLEEMVGEMNERLEAMRADGSLPASIETSLAGSASKLEDVTTALLGDGTFLGVIGSSMVLALLVVYLLMCMLFQSFLRPLIIMFSVPLATLGGFLALYAVHKWSTMDRYMPEQMLDVLTMLGFVILIGVVVNNAILIVHQSLNFMRGESETEGGLHRALPAREAIAEAVHTRVRPIFMTTLTSIGGLLPLVVMPGSGSELYRGLGAVVLGGLLVSTVFTLVLVPALLSLLCDAEERLRAGHAATVAPEPLAAGH